MDYARKRHGLNQKYIILIAGTSGIDQFLINEGNQEDNQDKMIVFYNISL